MAIGDDYKLTGQTRSSDAESREHQASLYAKRMTEIPSDLQQRFEYNGDGTVLYAGYAPRGLASSAAGWMIHKFTYTTQMVTLRQTAFTSWDGRAAGSYA